MNPDTLHSDDFLQALGLNEMSPDDRDEVLMNIGDLILESTIFNVVAGLTAEESAAFDAFVSQDPSPEAMLNELKRLVPTIEEMIISEARAFKEECVAVMNRQSTSAPTPTTV